MSSRILIVGVRFTLHAGVAAALAGCSADTPTSTVDPNVRPSFASSGRTDKVAICHHTGSGVDYLDVAQRALAGHLGHGDYVTTLRVSHDFSETGDGVHFARIGDALGAARAGRLARGELTAAACRITIAVSAGVYRGTAIGPASGEVEHFPFIVDVPAITLRGALVMGVDAAGRATGVGTTDDETTLRSIEPLPTINGAPTPIVVANSHPGGSAGSGLTVEGFVFQSGAQPALAPAGLGVLSVRATGLTIRGNRFESFGSAVDLRASSGDVVQNQAEGTGACDLCLVGPGTYRAIGNRVLEGGIEGIITGPVVVLPLPSGVEPYDLPATSETWAEIRNNEVRDHRRLPAGAAIRVDAQGLGAPNVHAAVHAAIQDNRLVNNRFGIIVHAGFPAAGTDLKGDVDVTLSGNAIEQSCQAKLLVALSRHGTALGLANGPYLRNSTFSLSLAGDVSWNDVWFSHPAGFGNTLTVDGQAIPNGNRQFYSATECPGN